jgi:sulfur-carrier protein adenylyltransferase/sulfurtransferase
MLSLKRGHTCSTPMAIIDSSSKSPWSKPCIRDRVVQFPPMSNVPLIHVEDLKERIDSGDIPFLLDVRERDERAICNIGGLLIPLDDLPRRIGELDPNRETVVYCRSGSRSAMAAEFLLAHGFRDVKNLAGGILAWAMKVDPTMPTY